MERPIDPPEGKVSRVCECCGDDIMEGEDCYMIGDTYYCDGCVMRTEAPYGDEQ